MQNREQLIADIAREVIARLTVQLPAPRAAAPPSASQDGVFETVDEAVKAAGEAQKRVAKMSLDDRGKAINIIRRICEDRSAELARRELDET